MKKTLILCFIHGFKGGESTFGDKYQFTEHLRDVVAEKLPKVDVRVLVYPKYETRGELGDCVMRFRSWLEEKVIDIEVASATPSPTVDPSVRTILIGHSMGGIVAAEAVIGLTSEKPIYSEDGIEKSDRPSFNSLMFPYIQGVLAFDTPYLGISPGVVAHNAESQYQSASAAFTQISQITGLGASLWGAAGRQPQQGSKANSAPPAALPAPPAAPSPGTQQQQQQQQQSGNAWQKWGKMAMYAGAAGAVAAGGAAAWVNREQLSEGWTWVSSHLEFVGCLARAEELKKRISYMVQLNQELDVGFANLYTRLGQTAPAKQVSMVGRVIGSDRTFCNLPSKQVAGLWKSALNDKATDETWAHMNMFNSKENPAYETLTQDAAGLITEWLQNDWYMTSSEPKPMIEL
ncbi:hypothetical protein B0I35DRAFT_473149 [Stachybotrys elegans]|uniref:DUF676 domain-containing protein n=1 Tax=Stachybotrys elegans TaxID=80388 RepID=A0A8K0T5H1_9HYPO|nr:hypothetical protein B0I35DRAFT_473149 [Stachybotrys elegans]